MVYGVFEGCYSDWEVIGYFNNRLDADKYCAVYGNRDYYVKEMRNLQDERDLSNISLKYEHKVTFDFRCDEWIMREDPTNYECYISEELRPNKIRGNHAYGTWVCFHVNIDKDNRKHAEKIAQDYLYQLLSYTNSKRLSETYVNLMNDKFLESYRLKEEQRKEEENRQKELAELKRLKEKYEN